MADKAYIVVNEEQEREVLENYDKQGKTWCSGTNLLRYSPSEYFMDLPYVIYEEENGLVYDNDIYLLAYKDVEVVYDGRKESKMKISKKVYDALVGWKESMFVNKNFDIFVGSCTIDNFPKVIDEWWANNYITDKENNNRLIAIIRWVNGEDVFEVEKPKKWVVRSKGKNSHGDYLYATLKYDDNLTDVINCYGENYATKFDTKEEAESWANAYQEVIEVEA